MDYSLQKNYCDILFKEGFLLCEEKGNARLFRLNNHSRIVREWKRVLMLQILVDSGMEKALNNPFYVYGSVASGDYTEESDLDIFVLGIREMRLDNWNPPLRPNITYVPYYKIREYMKSQRELIEQIRLHGIMFGDEDNGLSGLPGNGIAHDESRNKSIGRKRA